jgi:hypothetical protein
MIKIVNTIGCHKKVMLRDSSIEDKDRALVANLVPNIRESRRAKQHMPHRIKRKDFEEDRQTLQVRKLSVDLNKKVYKAPSPDHRKSIESEFS